MTARVRTWIAAALIATSACDCDDGSGLTDVAPDLEVTPTAVDFGDVRIGEFTVRGLTLTNKGLSPLTLGDITIVSDGTEFAWASPLPQALAPEQSIELAMTFTPADLGEELGKVTIVVTDANVGSREVSLRGVGVAGDVAVTNDGAKCGDTDGSMSFGNVVPGQMAERTITVAASGNAVVKILSVALEPGISTEFGVEALPTGGVLLAPGETRAVKATYAPIDGGTDMGTIIVTTDAASRPSIRIPICGAGTAPAICARPVPLDLGAGAVGNAVQGTLTIESCGAEPLAITSVTLSMDGAWPTAAGFAIASAPMLPATLAPTDTTPVGVSYTPSAIAAGRGFIKVESNALGNSPAYFQIDARGAMPCTIAVAPMTVVFNNTTGSATKSVLIANNGATACTVDSIAVTAGQAQFVLQNPPVTPLSVGPGASTIVSIEYTPSAMGPDVGTLAVDEGGVTHSVNLMGNAPLGMGCQLEVTPSFVNFGAVEPGQIRTAVVTVNNLSSDLCRISAVMLDPSTSPDISNTSRNFGLVLPNRTKDLTVTYRPTSPGTTASGILIITTTDEDTPEFQVPLFGAAGQTGICVSPLHLPFGDTNIARTMDFIIYACGGSDVTVTGFDWTTPDVEFTLLNPPTTPFNLTAGANQTITAQYTPMDMIGDEAFVTVRSNDPVNPAIEVRMTGGPEIVPSEAGRYLYYWQIPSPLGGDIVRLPLQGTTTVEPYWGPRTGKSCSGCHEVSPDGRYVALIELPNPTFKIVDTTSDVALSLPQSILTVEYMSWNPNPNTNPPYQFAYASAGKIFIGSVFQGRIRELQGANNINDNNSMPSWGSNGQIAVVQGNMVSGGMGGGTGFSGATHVVLVPEAGGTATPLAGASNNSFANYYPRISPNGRWVAITRSQQASTTISASDARLHLVASDNSGLDLDLPNANSATNDGASSYATWSVDGAFLSFASNRAGGVGGWDIYVAPIDPLTGADGAASNVAQANTSEFEHAAQWSP